MRIPARYPRAVLRDLARRPVTALAQLHDLGLEIRGERTALPGLLPHAFHDRTSFRGRTPDGGCPSKRVRLTRRANAVPADRRASQRAGAAPTDCLETLLGITTGSRTTSLTSTFTYNRRSWPTMTRRTTSAAIPQRSSGRQVGQPAADEHKRPAAYCQHQRPAAQPGRWRLQRHPLGRAAIPGPSQHRALALSRN
jgi:hypothetical protein